jgi:5-formyltetrahydrofolate cyclo-ligase
MQQPAVSGPPDETSARKQDIRAQLRKRRAARATSPGITGDVAGDIAGDTAGDIAEGLARVWAADGPPVPPGAAVAAYLARPGEPGTVALRRALAGSGARVLVPWLCEDGDLDWVADPGPDAPPRLRPEGLLLGREAVLGVVAVLLPALAADTAGRRLGQGGGSYDRVLARVGPAPLPPTVPLPPAVPPAVRPARPLLIACVHDDEVFDAATDPLPEEPHDRRVDAVLTPTRFLDVRGSAAAG